MLGWAAALLLLLTLALVVEAGIYSAEAATPSTKVCNGYLVVDADKFADGTVVVSYADYAPRKEVSVTVKQDGEEVVSTVIPCSGKNVELARDLSGRIEISMCEMSGRNIGHMEFLPF